MQYILANQAMEPEGGRIPAQEGEHLHQTELLHSDADGYFFATNLHRVMFSMVYCYRVGVSLEFFLLSQEHPCYAQENWYSLCSMVCAIR
jgi:hypothetical protein